ncbi:Hypothetical predicted protein [Pelobates cultripes]|uniref:Uncharacterized protein n=1 Tax=Pelobates cultripes TaxID=61616 RepID=A0AAD1WTG6_PELCU|nr:Hypothetical predicted protein [Pelobates cultripes]
MTDLLDKLGDPNLGQEEITNVFSTNPLSSQGTINDNINTAFFEIQKIYQEQIKSFWELTSLKQYLEQKLVPRGLRPDILLQDKIQTEEQLSEWNSILLSCSFKLMDFLVKLETNIFETSNLKLKGEIALIKKYKSDDLYTPMEIKLQQNITNFRHHLKIKKHNKFQRDFKDFKSGTIFRQTNKNTRRKNSYRGSSSGETDWSDQDQQSQNRRRSPFIRNRTQTRDTSSQLNSNKSILKNSDKVVSFLDIPISGDTNNSIPTVPPSNPFLDQQQPYQQRGRLRDRDRWSYKTQNRTPRT